MKALTQKETLLLRLGQLLRRADYNFVTVTPASHERVLKRTDFLVSDPLRAVFGWNQPFMESQLSPEIFGILSAADALKAVGTSGGGEPVYKSKVRFSTFPTFSVSNSGKTAEQKRFYIHSSYPTEAEDSVFFGPDTYRYISFVARELELKSFEKPKRFKRGIDIGSGSGAAGLIFSQYCDELVLSDISDRAISFARVNQALEEMNSGAPLRIQHMKSDLFNSIEGKFDLILANPPFIVDEKGRDYRDGGGHYGSELSAQVIEQSIQRLQPGGLLLVYTASAFKDGQCVLWNLIKSAVHSYSHQFTEIDPDIFGEELSKPQYASIERIAAVGLVLEAQL